jgi:hypothetical protein
VYLDALLWRNWSSLRYLIPDSEGLSILDGDRAPEPPTREARLVVWPYANSLTFLPTLPANGLVTVREGPSERGDLESEARLLCLIYEVADACLAPGDVRARFLEGIELLGYETHSEEAGLRIRLFWRAGASVDTDYTAFVHWLRGEATVAQSDSYPAQGHYPTHVWRPGDTVADDHLLPSSEPLLEGDTLIVGMYDLQTMQRLQVLDPRGVPIGDSVALTLP